jgi:hypothetical protein
LQLDLRKAFVKLWREADTFVDAKIGKAEGTKKTD